MIEQASPIEKTVLGNGLTIITEQMSHVRSASIGIWVRSGSRHEPAELNGISHFIEHTLFKGTRNRTSREIAVESDAIGGHVDAFTSREVASYYVKVLDQHMSRAFDLLADLVTAPLFANDELDRERNVVLEEIKMVEDTPDDLVHEVFVSNFWPDHPLGRSILGTAGTLSTFDHDRVVDFFTNVYTPRNLVVAAAGNVDHRSFVEMVAAYLGDLTDRPARRSVSVPRPASRRIILNKDLEQAHLVLGTRCPSMVSEDRYAVHLLNVILGGGMSSRLFQKVREELGLAYAVYSFQSFYKNAGVSGVYVGTRPEWADRAADVIKAEMRSLCDNGLTADELADMKSQVKGQIVLSLEGSGSRLHRLAGTALYDEPYLSVDEIMSRVEAVTHGDINALAAEFFDPDKQVVLRLGPEK